MGERTRVSIISTQYYIAFKSPSSRARDDGDREQYNECLSLPLPGAKGLLCHGREGRRGGRELKKEVME